MKDSPRSSKGRFKKGASGNPTGRPAGSRNKATLACEQLLEGEGEELILKVIEKAKQGDMHALRLCLERIIPVRKERSINLELRPVKTIQDVPIQYQDILTAVGNGSITPGEGEALSNIVTSHAQIMDRVELDRRVKELENTLDEVRSWRRQESDYARKGPNTVLFPENEHNVFAKKGQGVESDETIR
jgi:hypothetical protein